MEAALIARDGGKNLSEWLKVQNEILAADLDRCARFQLRKFDNAQRKEDAKLHNFSVMAAFNGQPLKFNDDDED